MKGSVDCGPGSPAPEEMGAGVGRLRLRGGEEAAPEGLRIREGPARPRPGGGVWEYANEDQGLGNSGLL